MRPRSLALLASAATFLLLVVGGLVNPTGSALACPDWPLCNGQAFPRMTGGVLYEHSHRLAVLAVVALTLLLVVQCWRRRSSIATRALVLVTILVPLVLLQAALGAITVIARLPWTISTAHLGVAMAFFMCVMTCAHWLAQGRDPGRIEAGAPRGFALVALAATYLQALLGGFLRHAGANRACGLEFPLCEGEWWPEHAASQVHQLHRALGVALVVLILAAALVTARSALRAGRRLSRACALAAPFLSVAQVALGIATVRSGIAVPQVMGHFIVGMALLACWHAAYVGLGPRRLA